MLPWLYFVSLQYSKSDPFRLSVDFAPERRQGIQQLPTIAACNHTPVEQYHASPVLFRSKQSSNGLCQTHRCGRHCPVGKGIAAALLYPFRHGSIYRIIRNTERQFGNENIGQISPRKVNPLRERGQTENDALPVPVDLCPV